MNHSIDIILSADQLEGTSATLSKWLIKVGSQVKNGDPIIELETDKVAMEICAPADGVLLETLANEGDEIEVEAILGRLAANDTAQGPAAAEADSAETIAAESPGTDVRSATLVASASLAAELTNGDARRLIGPAVRRLLRQHDLDIDKITGSGRRGRVTRDDVNLYLADHPQTDVAQTRKHTLGDSPYASGGPQPRPLQGTLVAHSPMRKAIAKHMVTSLLHSSPHVTSLFEMDMSNLIEHRKWHKKEFAERGVNLTLSAYFVAAAAVALKAVPQVNARFHEDALELFEDINIGVATALGDEGLVVPVLQQVQTLSLFAIAQTLSVQTEKARSRTLTANDMRNGTFSISNHGVSGSLFAAPIIINQPQVAILGVGKLDKRVVVREIKGIDTMQIKPLCYVSLSIDHRALDGYQANRFLQVFVDCIEHWGQ